MKRFMILGCFLLMMTIPVALAGGGYLFPSTKDGFIKEGDRFLRLAGSKLKTDDFYNGQWKNKIGESDRIVAYIAEVYYKRAQLCGRYK